MKQSTISKLLISLVVILYLGVSLVSTFHVIDFFALTNVGWASILLAVMFEVGQMGTLFLITSDVMKKVKKGVVWALFILLTAMQVMGNMYYAYVHAEGFTEWVELFGLESEPVIFQKRILAIVAGAILPLVALGFVKSLSDYLNPDKGEDKKEEEETDESELELLLDEKRPEERSELIVEETPKTSVITEDKAPEERSELIDDVVVEGIKEELLEEPEKVTEEEDLKNQIISEKDEVLNQIRVYKNRSNK